MRDGEQSIVQDPGCFRVPQAQVKSFRQKAEYSRGRRLHRGEQLPNFAVKSLLGNCQFKSHSIYLLPQANSI